MNFDRDSVISNERDDLYAEIENRLFCLWKEVLKVDSIDGDDNFFDLGGHSLMAAILVNRIRYEFKVEISLKEFFRKTTIDHLASLIMDYQKDGGGDLIPDIIP